MEVKEAQQEIDGKLVAQMIMDFTIEFRRSYSTDVMISPLCAVGPLQAMIGLAIQRGLLKHPTKIGVVSSL